MRRFRIIQIVINGLLVIFLTIMVISFVFENRWRFDRGLFRDIALALVSVGLLLALLGSIRLNFLLLRNSDFSIFRRKKIFPQLGLLALSIAILYFAFQTSPVAIYYDSHLSTHYMTIELPHWLGPSDEAASWRYSTATVEDNQIVSLLFYLLGISFLAAMNNAGLFSKGLSIRYKIIGSILVICQIALGVMLLSLATFLFFGFYTELKTFLTQLEGDPALKNVSNIAGFAFAFLNYLLLFVYAQWILRDGFKLRKSVVKECLRSNKSAI